MKKIILCLSLVLLISTCFVTNATATPKITGVQGGYGVTATIEDANTLEWRITILGPYVIYGTITEGFISGESATIRTPIYPPTLGVGNVVIRVTIDRIIFPDVVATRTAFMLGPFVLFVQNIPY